MSELQELVSATYSENKQKITQEVTDFSALSIAARAEIGKEKIVEAAVYKEVCNVQQYYINELENKNETMEEVLKDLVMNPKELEEYKRKHSKPIIGNVIKKSSLKRLMEINKMLNQNNAKSQVQ